MTVSSSQNFDFLIVGQGVAGTLLSHFLLSENQKVMVIDRPLAGATSGIAAGVINPVTGRRMAKSWRYEDFLPKAKKTYLELENRLGEELWSEQNILRALPTVFEENEWSRRGLWPEHAPYFADEADLGNYAGKVSPVPSWGELKGAAKADMPRLVSRFRAFLRSKKILMEEVFDFSKLEIGEGGVRYGNFAAGKIIFCEGSKAGGNPYFRYLPFIPTKGELLLVRIPGSGFEKLLKNHIFIVPVGGDLYWVGSTSRFEFDGPEPTTEKRKYLESELKRVLTVPFEVREHQAGIRPTVYDKRPFLGLHPAHPQLGIFNGLGTKGALLGPYFASQMAGFLLGENEIEAEVDIQRHADKFAEGEM